MNKLKKISILFAAVLSLTMLASCGSDSKDTNKSDKSDSSTAEDKAVDPAEVRSQLPEC